MKPFYAPGDYVGSVTSQGFVKAKTGTMQFVLKFKVLGTPDPLAPESYITAPTQYERSIFRSITEKTMEYFLEDLQALGFTGDSFRLLDPGTQGFHDLRGRIIDVQCQHENDVNNEAREKWSVLRGSGKKIEAADPKELRQLDALFGKSLKGLKKDVPPKEAAANGGDPRYAGVSDDDVPF